MKKYILFLVLLNCVALHAVRNDYSFKLLTGNELQSIVPFMAAQRIAVFRDYPYLYEGNITEENEYCNWFTNLPHSAVAVAYLNGEPVGWVSGTGFSDFDVHFKGSNALLQKNGFDPKQFYYIPEAIIVPEHRRNSLIEKLHSMIEHHAKSLKYNTICFAEESHEIHPLKPVNYQPLDGLYLKAGYHKTPMIIKFPWLTIQADGSLKDEGA